MKPHFNKNDEILFYKYLDKAQNYYEFGSGGSTYQASLRQNLKSIHSVESDLLWHNKLKKMVNEDKRIEFIYVDMKTVPNTWGNPGPNSSINDWIAYSDTICRIESAIADQIDLILIDGRFRVACALKCFDIINDNCYVIFDDFLNRPGYHIVLDYYEIIDQTSDNVMVVLKKKKCAKPSRNIIHKYEKISS